MNACLLAWSLHHARVCKIMCGCVHVCVCLCVCVCVYLIKNNSIFYHNRLVHVSVLSCEHICTTTQHYNAFQCFIVSAMKTHGNKADLILSYVYYVMWQRKFKHKFVISVQKLAKTICCRPRTTTFRNFPIFS